MNKQLWAVAILVVVVMVVVAATGLDVLGCGARVLGEGTGVWEMALCVWTTAQEYSGAAMGNSVAYGLGWDGVIYLPVALQSRCMDWPCPGPAEPNPEE